MASIEELQKINNQLENELSEKSYQIEELTLENLELHRKVQRLENNYKIEETRKELSHKKLLSTTRVKRDAVAGEPSANWPILDRQKQPSKSDKTKKLLKNAIYNNAFLNKYDESQVEDLVAFMTYKEFSSGDTIITQGCRGNDIYAIAEGEVEVFKDGQFRRIMGAGEIFGELAILHGCLRQTSVVAKTICVMWTIDGMSFQSVMAQRVNEHQNQKFAYVNSVKIFENVPRTMKEYLADMMEMVQYQNNDYIIREGEFGDTYYIIQSGSVRVIEKNKEKRCLQSGDTFGDIALETEYVRTASIVAIGDVKCLRVDTNTYKLIKQHISSPKTSLEQEKYHKQKLSHETKIFAFDDLVKSKVLGKGGFGQVQLCTVKSTGDKYALKAISKNMMNKSKQRKHVESERDLMKTVDHPLLIKLITTFEDNKYVYMMLEVCLGGELFHWLKKLHRFTNQMVEFYVGCVIQALEYLHGKGIVYRDLKPENLLLDNNGYVKVADFGLAKEINHGRTYTFCGTPEYVAPEVINLKGTTFAVDIWALGVLMFELLTGYTPFYGENNKQIYQKIQRGMGSLKYPAIITSRARSLISKLCQMEPKDRLGYGPRGFKTIRKHKWFKHFEWSHLQNQAMSAPIQPVVDGENYVTNFSDLGDELEDVKNELEWWDF